MSTWTVELVRTDVGREGRVLSSRREEWLWRAYEGGGIPLEVLQRMYEKNDYLFGVASGRTHHEPDRVRDLALSEAREAATAYDLRRGNEKRETVEIET